MKRLKDILHHKTLKGKTWSGLAEDLPVSGNALSLAFRRNKVNSTYIKHLEGKLDINSNDINNENVITKSTENTESTNKEQEIKTKAGSVYTENSDGTYNITVPLVPFDAYASYVEAYEDEVSLVQEWEKVSFNVDKIGLGKYLGFRSKGDSMNGGSLNDTPGRSLILGREIGRQHWLDGFRSSDYGFIIISKYNMMHKDIIDMDKEKGTIRCHSRNKSPEYADFDLKLNDVYQIFRVIKRTF